MAGYPGEQPALLSEAFILAGDHGLTVTELAHELAWSAAQVRRMHGVEEDRPALRLVNSWSRLFVGGPAAGPRADQPRRPRLSLRVPESGRGHLAIDFGDSTVGPIS